ncbi:MAG: ATP-binding protein [Desulfuromonadales bacterium]|nr:ATP-binding protein [Desulfuromonadales bacterium]MDT8423737.1 ATP-binding protein [Desulfuromonadales bacterium]
MFFNSLISRIIILNILLLSTVIGAFTLFQVRREQVHLVAATKENTELLLSTVEKSIFNSMRLGNSDDVQAVLEMVGRNHRLAGIKIFHPDGTILKSSRPWEIGSRVDANAFSLFHNGRTEGIFHVDGEDILGIIKPIYTDVRCYQCHGPGRKVVGVLNLNFSLADTTSKLRESSQYLLLSTALVVILLSMGVSFILLRFVRRPMQLIADNMARVEAGDLGVRMEPKYSDEMGSLMRSFNSMVMNLERVQHELEQYHYKQMARADRLASVGEMATGLAHEIRNPLAGISGAVSVLADDFAADDPRREIVRQVLEQIDRLNKTVTDLLYFGKPGKPELTHVNINELVNNTMFFLNQHPGAHKVHRFKDLAHGLPPLLIDEKQIQQVLFNVLINGIQAMPNGGTLSVRTSLAESTSGKVVRIEIEDTGSGIAADQLDKIFTPFYTSKTQGTGLGLPICRQLLEQHDGAIWADSKVGEGTTFILELPADSGTLTFKEEE